MLTPLFWLIWPLLYAAGAAGFGTAVVIDEALLGHILSATAGCILPLRGIWYIVLARRSNTPLRPSMLVQTVLESALALVIVFLPRFSYQAFLLFLLLYFSFHGVVQGINAVIYGRNRMFQYFTPALSQAVLFLQLFLGVLLLPDDIRQSFVMSGSGFLLSMLGHAYLFDWLAMILKNKRAGDVFRKISITMPGFGGLGIPFRLLHALCDHTSGDIPDAEIIFNYGKRGEGLAGHCELCVNGKTYTYGNYDPDSRAILKTMGNGIIFRADKQKQIDFLREQGRTVVVYGLKFNPEQRRRLLDNLAQFDATLIPWRDQAAHTPPDEYIHEVLDRMDADIYRIGEGRFKTYFLPTINCVTLTGSLLRGTAAGSTVIPGVYTPGAYMDALHRLYLAGGEPVVSVNVYRP